MIKIAKVTIPEQETEGYNLLLSEIEDAKSKEELKNIKNLIKHLQQRIKE